MDNIAAKITNAKTGIDLLQKDEAAKSDIEGDEISSQQKFEAENNLTDLIVNISSLLSSLKSYMSLPT